jgi:hypothetical protein
MPSDASDVGVSDPMNDLEVLVPQWEWCQKDERQHDAIDYLDSGAADWGVYGETQNSEIEVAFQAGHSMVEVSVGIRIYQIIFDFKDFGKSGMVQRDHKWGAHCAVRAVRRRLVNPQTRIADLCALKAIATKRFEDKACAVCMQAFADTPTMPVASLPGCGHHLHTACTQRLADQQSDCPLCRTKVDWKSIGSLKRCLSCIPRQAAQDSGDRVMNIAVQQKLAKSDNFLGDRVTDIADQQKHTAPPNVEENWIGTESTA